MPRIRIDLLLLAAICIALGAVSCGGDASDTAAESEPAADAAADEPIRIPLERMPGVDAVAAYTRQLYAGELDELYERFSDEFRAEFSRTQLQEFHDLVRDRFGNEVSLVSIQRKESGDYRAFARFAIFDGYDGVVQLKWILRSDDLIAGLELETSPKKPEPRGTP